MCTWRAASNNYINFEHVVVFNGKPVLTVNNWEENEKPDFNLTLYQINGKVITEIENSKIFFRVMRNMCRSQPPNQNSL